MHLAGGHLQLSTESATAQCLAMSDGKPTAASATWNMEGPASEGGCTSDAECTPQGMLLTDTFFGQADGSFTVSSLPFVSYDVIVYFRMNEEHSFDIGSQQCATGRTPTTVRPLAAANGSFVSAGAYPKAGNYLRLSGCKGSNLTLDFTKGGQQHNHRKSMAGLQIVETGVPRPRLLGINVAGKNPNGRDKTGPIEIPPEVETGVVPQRNWINLEKPGCGMKRDAFNASQHLYEARIDGTAGHLRSSSIMQAKENALITTLECVGCASPQRVSIALSISDYWHLPKAAGVSSTQLWTRHENNYANDNPMSIGSCDPNAVFVRGVSRFLLADSLLRVKNGTDDTCPMLLPAGARTGSWALLADKERVVVRGPCSDAAAEWTLVAADRLFHVRSRKEPALCLGVPAEGKDQIAYAVACKSTAAALLWAPTSDPGTGKPFRLELQTKTGKSGGCLVSTAGNTNNSLSIVSEVREDGKAVALTEPHTDGKLQATANFMMRPGHEYEIVTALISRRDLAEPGQYRYASLGPAATADVVAAASRAAAGADTARLRVEHSAEWRRFWNASSVDLGPKRSQIEGWWYGMQYLLGSASRAGEVVPSLFGPWVIYDPPSWVDDIVSPATASRGLPQPLATRSSDADLCFYRPWTTISKQTFTAPALQITSSSSPRISRPSTRCSRSVRRVRAAPTGRSLGAPRFRRLVPTHTASRYKVLTEI